MPPVSRRSVLCTLGAGLAAPALLRAKGRKRLPIAFSTLGCPGWKWKTVLEQADRLGYAAIELRGIEGEMDLTKRPELVGDGLKQTRRDLEALGIVISDLGASARMHEKDPTVRAAQLDEGRRFIDLAHALGVILGGRLGWVLIYGTILCSVTPDYAQFCDGLPMGFLTDPIRIIAAWEGGMSFHGGLLGVVIAVWLFCRRRKLAMLPIADLACAFAPIGLFFTYA